MPRRSPADADRFERLGPTCFSGTGFLGRDTRDWEEIIAADAAILERLGLDRAIIFRALRQAYASALEAGGDPVEVAPKVLAVCLECRGRIPSPFPGGGTFSKHQVRVEGETGGAVFVITELGLHLIDRHGFFQGLGSPFRIDPAQAARVFRLHPVPREK